MWGLVLPTATLDQHTRPGQRLRDLRIGQPVCRLDATRAVPDQRLQGECDEASVRIKSLSEQANEVQDDLASARHSLRRMIRAENTP